MSAKTISELANWDGRLNQQRKWRHSSSNLARDPYHSPLESPPVDTRQPSSKFLDKKRAPQSFPSNSQRGSLAHSPANARPSGRFDTTSTPRSIHRPRQAATVHTVPNSALQPSAFITSSRSSHLAPNSSVHASRVHISQLASSSKSIMLSQPASTMDSKVIDLTLDDTEDEFSVTDMLVPKSKNSNYHYADSSPSRRAPSSGCSSPIALEQSLFTPPPPSRRRTRFFIAVPPLPKGLTKADYQPLRDHSTVPSLRPTVTSTLGDSSLAGSPVTQERPLKKHRGKEREHDVFSAPKTYERPIPTDDMDVVPNAFLDVFGDHTMIPLYDEEDYPPLAPLDLLSNTRFRFAHAWRQHALRLREAELDCTFQFKLLGRACGWARSATTPLPRLSGSTGCVSIEQLRPWQLVSPDSSTQEESTSRSLDEGVHLTESQTSAEVVTSCLSPPDDAQPGPCSAGGPTPSSSAASHALMVGDMENDMNQYFNGLGDSPAKRAPQEFAPTYTFRPHLLQATGSPQMSSIGFPSLEFDPRLIDTGDHGCFLGVPPSPPAEMDSPTAPGPIVDPPSQPAEYFAPSPNDIFTTSPVDAWPFEQGEGFLPDDHSQSNNDVTTTTIGTIDPSLLGSEETQVQVAQPRVSKPPTPKQRSKLPKPVIYIRRPIDSSNLPLLSGKRPVRIKYRDSGDCPTPSTQTPSNPARDSKQSSSDTDDNSRTKRHPVPSRKSREHQAASESNSDYIPEPSTSKIKIKPKLKQPSLRDNESAVERQDMGPEAAPVMSYCHQCRNKSARPKMLCSNVVHGRVCGKPFCSRCILYRYPEITFDEHSAGFLCPVCTNTCNCSYCSRNRGEEFVSMRLGGQAASFFKTKVTLVRDVNKPLPRAQSPLPPPPPKNVVAQRSTSVATTPTPEPSALSVQPQFWAHVYGMEGERMGSAFMTRENMDRLLAQGSSASAPAPKQPTKTVRKPPRKHDKQPEKPRGPRVFIGRPLESWKVRGVRDLEPSVDVEVRGKGKAKETGRFYVGDPGPLYEPYGRMPGPTSPTPPPSSRCSTPAVDSDGVLTPLSDLEGDDWPQPEVGECCLWAPPLPPGVVVDPLDPSDLSGPSGPSGVGLQFEGPSQGLGAEMDVDEPVSASSTALSEEELARAIGAALAAISVGSPC